MASKTVPIWQVYEFRGRNDDGGETTATWKTTYDNTNWTQTVDQIFRLRFVILETAGATTLNEPQFKLQYNLNSGGWNNVATSGTPVIYYNSTYITDDQATTDQIGGNYTGYGFIAGRMDENGTHTALAEMSTNRTEMEWVLWINSASVANNDIFQFRPVLLDGTVLNNYAYTMAVTVFENAAPSVSLTSPTDTDTINDPTPALEFLGTDANSDTLEYQVQVDTVDTFDSQAETVDSYPESNQSNDNSWGLNALDIRAQSFEGNGKSLYSVKFYLKKYGNPTGTITAKLYAHTGTYGTSSVGTGTALKTSTTTLDVSTLSTSYQLVEFLFDGSYELTESYYVIALEDINMSFVSGNYIIIGSDNTSPSHGGNYCYRTRSTSEWGSNTSIDNIFYIYTGIPLIDAVSTTDAGFENLDTPADTHPFTQNEDIRYTVQSGDALTKDTYYWRARAWDGYEWGNWTTARSFTLNQLSVVSLSSPNDTETINDPTPALEFLGTDADGDTLEYQIQIYDTSPITGIVIADSYSEANQSNDVTQSGTFDKLGQSFEGDGNPLYSVKFYLKKYGSPVATFRAALYEHSGTYGSSSVGTGSPIAVSDAFDVSTLGTDYALVEFIFTTHPTLSEPYYVVVFEEVSVTTLDAGNYIRHRDDTTSPTHSGNLVYYSSGAWNYFATADLIFYVYSGSAALIDAVSTTDAGFENLDDGGDTHPFTQNQDIRYTVQAGDELSDDTYYWRVRAYDGDEWGDWATTRSFTLSSGITLSTATVAVSGKSLSVAKGSVSKALDCASITTSGKQLSPQISQHIHLSNASISVIGNSGSIVPGSYIVEAVSGILSASSALSVIAGAKTLQLSSASISLSSALSVVPGSYSISLNSGILSLSSALYVSAGQALISLSRPSIAVQSNQASIFLSTVIHLSLANVVGSSSLSIVAGQKTINLSTAASVLSSSINVIPGLINISLQTSTILSQSSLFVVPGIKYVALNTSGISASSNLSVLTGPVSLAVNTANIALQSSLSVVPGTFSALLSVSSCSANAQSITIVSNAILGLNTANISLNGLHLSTTSATIVPLSNATISLFGNNVSLLLGSISIDLASSSISVIGNQAYVIPGEAVIGLALSSSIVYSPPMSIHSHYYALLSTASLSAQSSLQIIPGSANISLSLGSILISGSSVFITYEKIIHLLNAELSLSSNPISAIPGSVHILADAGNIVVSANNLILFSETFVELLTAQLLSSSSLSVQTGQVSIGLDSALLDANSNTVSLVLGPISTLLGLSSISLNSLIFVSPGTVGISIEAGLLSFTANALDIITGSVSTYLDLASISSSSSLQVLPGGASILLDISSINSYSSILVFAQGYIALSAASVTSASGPIVTSVGGVTIQIALSNIYLASSLSLSSETLVFLSGAVISSYSNSTSIEVGIVSINMQLSSIVAIPLDLSVLSGTISIQLSNSYVAINCNSLLAIPGEAATILSGASLSVDARSLTILPGPHSIQLDMSSIVVGTLPIDVYLFLRVLLGIGSISVDPKSISPDAGGTIIQLDVPSIFVSGEDISVNTFWAAILLTLADRTGIFTLNSRDTEFTLNDRDGIFTLDERDGSLSTGDR